MYRDKCIESLHAGALDEVRRMRKGLNGDNMLRAINRTIETIRSSQSFYVGDIDTYLDFNGKIVSWWDDGFTAKYKKSLSVKRLDSMPFDLCWVSGELKSLARINPFSIKDKAGFLFERLSADQVWLYCFFQIGLTSSGAAAMSAAGFAHSGVKKNSRISLVDVFEFNTSGVKPINLFGYEKDVDTWEGTLTRYSKIILSLLNFFDVLSCKNIVKIRHDPPAKLNKKRIKAGKEPLYTYHTLDVILPGRRRMTEPGDPTGRTTRLHLCRGHFKEYTADKPLFGRHVGRYWWQPMARGDKKKGVAMKDYRVKMTPDASETQADSKTTGN